ncbi:hypothetical protein GOODEAATRI_027015 [Goodea atripinnis]|uniref:Uncharacterized protein n=1 Tax=Goodea atripinnis TaxID=208336 RepID=A0ABV0NYI6_9TELE
MMNGWGSASEDERNFSSHRSSLGSSSDGSIFTHCSFAQALVAAADKAGYRLEGTSLSKRGKGLSHRPRPSSPFSTDGSTVGTHSLGHQRATRPARKPRSQGTTPHRRDAGVDGETKTGQGRIQGARSASSMAPPTDRKASSLERTPMSGPLCGPDDMKSSIDRQMRTSLEHHRQGQDRLGSMDRADDARRGHKSGTQEAKTVSKLKAKFYC